MPAEPKQTIGDQLRAFAKQRGDAAGAPFEPHPATRKLLQDEVARTFSARTIARLTTPPSWLATFWVRLALAGGLVAMFVVAAIFWLPNESATKTELTENRDKVAPAQQPASAPQPPVTAIEGGLAGGGAGPSDVLALKGNQPEIELAQRSGLRPASEPNSLLRKPEGETTPASRTAENQRGEAESSSKLALQQGEGKVASAPPVLATPPASVLESKSISKAAQAPLESHPRFQERLAKQQETPAAPSLNAEDKAIADELRQTKEVAVASARSDRTEAQVSLAASVPATNVFFFSRTDVRAKYRRNFNSPPVPPVLQSFQIQQSGANVHILDADGSVYEGVAEQPTTDPRFQFGEGSSSRQKAVANKLAEQDKGNLERNVGQRQMRSVAAGTANSIGNIAFGRGHQSNCLPASGHQRRISTEHQPNCGDTHSRPEQRQLISSSGHVPAKCRLAETWKFQSKLRARQMPRGEIEPRAVSDLFPLGQRAVPEASMGISRFRPIDALPRSVTA